MSKLDLFDESLYNKLIHLGNDLLLKFWVKPSLGLLNGLEVWRDK